MLISGDAKKRMSCQRDDRIIWQMVKKTSGVGVAAI
jgi:hypothetical protein